jgi:hypothetical protein
MGVLDQFSGAGYGHGDLVRDGRVLHSGREYQHAQEQLPCLHRAKVT